MNHTMKRIIIAFAALLCCHMLPAAKSLAISDTLWLNDQYERVEKAQATVMAIVQEVDEEANVATVHCFDIETARLLSVQRRVASGKGVGLKTGKQLLYDEEGNIQSAEEYALYTEEKKGKKRTRLVSETLFDPDGNVSEEVSFVYKKVNDKERRYYERQCYYPDGKLQYTETQTEDGCKTAYFKPNGKKDKHPEHTFPLYLVMPDFPGGTEALFGYLQKTVKYPRVAEENRIQGRVIVQFNVGKDGTIEDVEVLRSGGDPSLDKEAVRVVKAMPKWNPGKKRGQPVRIRYTVPVNFKLK